MARVKEGAGSGGGGGRELLVVARTTVHQHDTRMCCSQVPLLSCWVQPEEEEKGTEKE